VDRVRRRGLELVLGIGTAIVMLAAVLVIYKSFRGDFGDDVHVSARISQAGDALEQGDIVTYRDVIVGEVTDATGNLDGSAALTLKIHRSDAGVIPANVTAIAVPASLFGATKIELLPAGTPSSARLHDGALVAADRDPAAEGLQTALANAYTLLTAVHPAQLDAGLSALATALQGQGRNVGKLIQDADDYLIRLAPQLPHLDHVITSLATVTRTLARNSPTLLHSVSDLLVLSRGILADKQAIAGLLDVAPKALHDASLLLSSRNVDNAVSILTSQQPVLAAFAADPQALPRTIDGFREFADSFASALGSGPYLRVNIIITGANVSALVNVAAGRKGTLFTQTSDPPEYTPADCPRYPGADGPNCTSASAAVSTTGTAYGGTVSSVGSPREVAAVRTATSAITGVPQSRVPPVADLLLGPLLRGAATVIAK
jgi:virulence factor Mce-like protein